MSSVHYPLPLLEPEQRDDHFEREPIAWAPPSTRPARAWRPALAGGAVLVLAATVLFRVPGGDPEVDRASIAGFAEAYVATYLGQAGDGAEWVLDPFLGGEVSLVGMEPGSWYVRNAAAITITPDGDAWLVVVAADLLGRVDGGYEAVGTTYFGIGIVERSGRLTATGLPMRVPPPEAPEPTSGRGSPQSTRFAPPAGPAADVVAGFAQALLAGDGDPGRFFESGAEVTEFAEPPYAEVAVRRMAAGPARADRSTVLVELSAVDRAGRSTVLHLAIELAVTSTGLAVASFGPTPG